MKIPLTQIRFLYRARDQFGKKVGVVDGEHTWTYEEYFQRCNRLANLFFPGSVSTEVISGRAESGRFILCYFPLSGLFPKPLIT